MSASESRISPASARLVWDTIPSATNSVLYTTNLASPVWLTLTNFVTPAAPPFAPITNVIYDAVLDSSVQRYYRVQINPNVTDLFGP